MTESNRVEKFPEKTEDNSVLISGYLTNLLHRPLLPSLWRNRFWVLRSEGALYCYRNASSKNHLLRIDLTDPSIRIRTGEPVSELRGVKWSRAIHNDRKLCILVKKKRYFFYTDDSTHLSAWDEALHSVADKYAFNSNWTLGSQRGKLGREEGPAMSVQDMRGGDGRGFETEDKEAILESYKHRKSAMARAQLATLFGAQPSPSLSRVQNYGEEMEPLVQRVQRLSDASSTVVTLKRRHSELEKSVQSPVDEHGPFTFQPRPGSPVPEVSERKRKTSHSQPKPTQTGLVLSKKREEEEEEKDFMRKMERFRQLATQHELPMRTAGDLQRINRRPSRVAIPDQFMRPTETPPPSPPPPPHESRLVSSSSNLASLKERMQPVGAGRHSPYMPPRSTHRRAPPQVDQVIPPPHAFQVSKDVTQETILLQEESLNELRKVLSNFSGQDPEPNSETIESVPPSEEYLARKRPSFASKRMESIKVDESLDEVRPSQAWRRAVPSVPSKSPLAVEAPFTFSQLDTADTTVKSADTPIKTADTPVKSADTPVKSADTPVKSADTPRKTADTPRKTADTPIKTADTPVKSADTPVKSADTPVKSADTPVKSADTPRKTADTPVKTADTPIKTADTPVKTADTPVKTADCSIKTADYSPNTTAAKLPVATRSLPDVIKGEDPSEEARQDRVQLAVDWVSGEVEKMIKEIISLGTIGQGGQTQIEFGYLFAETANKFDALSGILKTAKKLGVITYEGEVLFQGVNDKTVITLLKGDIGDIKKETFIRTPVSPRGTRVGGSPPGKHRKFGTATQQYGLNQCAVCGKQVYQVEYVGATDKAFHRWCFRCCVCQVTLSPTSFATIADKYYCTVHYERSYMSAGGYRELEGHPSPLT